MLLNELVMVKALGLILLEQLALALILSRTYSEMLM